MMNKQSGFSLIEVLIASVIGIIVIGSISIMTVQIYRKKSNTEILISVNEFRNEVLGILSNDVSFKNTINHVPNNPNSLKMVDYFSGVYKGFAGVVAGVKISAFGVSTVSTAQVTAADADPAKTPFAILDRNDSIFYSSTVPTNGISTLGQVCNTYPSQACPIRLDIKWTYECEEKDDSNLGPFFMRICYNKRGYINGTFVTEGGFLDQELQDKIKNIKINYTRKVKKDFRTFTVWNELSGAGATEGACSTNPVAPTKRTLSSIDSSNSVATLNADNTVTVSPGKYFCKASAPAYQVGRHSIHAKIEATAPGYSQVFTDVNGTAADATESTTRAYTNFSVDITNPTKMWIAHSCESVPAVPTQALGFTTDLGSMMGAMIQCTLMPD